VLASRSCLNSGLSAMMLSFAKGYHISKDYITLHLKSGGN